MERPDSLVDWRTSSFTLKNETAPAGRSHARRRREVGLHVRRGEGSLSTWARRRRSAARSCALVNQLHDARLASRFRFDPAPETPPTPTSAQTGNDETAAPRRGARAAWGGPDRVFGGVATMWCGPRSSMSWWPGTSVGEKFALAAWSDCRAESLRVRLPQKESRDDASDDASPASRVFVIKLPPFTNCENEIVSANFTSSRDVSTTSKSARSFRTAEISSTGRPGTCKETLSNRGIPIT